MKNIAVITGEKSDLSLQIESVPGLFLQYIKPGELRGYNLDLYDAFCILGGISDKPILFSPDERIRLEKQGAKGKRFFVEFCASIGCTYSAEPVTTHFKRLAFLGNDLGCLKKNDILDDQCNSFISTYAAPKDSRAVLVYHNRMDSYSSTVLKQEERDDPQTWALWYLTPDILVCNFRICNGIKSRFSPLSKWHDLFEAIVRWIVQESDLKLCDRNAYSCIGRDKNADELVNDVDTCISAGMSWYENAGVLICNGKGGILEGFHSEIDPNGMQKHAESVRADCSGEASLAFLSYFLLTHNEIYLEKMNNLQNFCFESMQIKSGLFKGMMRWTSAAWEVCYQDDASRAVIPVLLKFLYTKNAANMKEAVAALEFLSDTTGTDGTRPARTDNIHLDAGSVRELSQKPGNYPSAHYNAYYCAALLLCYQITGIEKFKDIGVKGLTTIMSAYPDTLREHSETQELCRLILPLSWLFWVTGEDRHQKWLYRVTDDLQKVKHKSGAYLEWDTGYKAACSHKTDSECSLLVRNGDPVVDMLYSVNWLPMGFSQAYMVTGDSRFQELWKEVSAFFVASQIHSDNPAINGAWARGFDADLMEYYGVPHDVGWGPWAIESGWTVSEILSGLVLGKMADRVRRLYADPPKFHGEPRA